ncbi:DUF1488 domain-containing protein [Shewanella sp. D64]|uniref:DUF1488 domain-containing protein n=1 Tax=unclassified Shewanella TaxID=196818 RepID=UPI0022BA28CD|nr:MULTISPECIES: DUF1488 domain-containing protein [unclassified Shewanella]MEC4727115.1 DUF1488 domain-containing protein [Shewanella sp. D64]MEC4739268.1 DUF1488 domain-containing protein [Shewanella sp. E94]WBJ95607.1 DUF1488 domain-containing protein [Shewanella sp. MTB7]
MNQSILFPDLQEWDQELQQIHFPVQVQGANITCRVSLSRLALLEGRTILDKEDALKVFNTYGFDIEDEIEMLIEQEMFDEQGGVSWL